MIFLYITLAVLACIVIGYVMYIKLIGAEGWSLAQHDQWPPREKGVPGGPAKRWLFTGAVMNSKQTRHQKMVHHPMIILKGLRLTFVKRFRFFWFKLKSKIKTGKWKIGHNITEQKIYDITTSGPLLLVSKFDGDLLSVTTPKMPISDLTDLDPSNFHMVLNIKTKKVDSAVWNGENLENDYGMIFSLLMATLIVWVHPQTHVASEMSAREIAKKKIEALEPSNRFVLALHDGLLYSSRSPLSSNHTLCINIDRQFVINTAVELRMPHNLNPDKMQFLYYRYLMESRAILIEKLKKYNLNVQPDFLFNNMIVHSIDHYLLYKHLSTCIWSMDGSDTNDSYWQSQIFSTVWVSDLESPFQKERIRKLSQKKFPFYKDLYTELVPLDKELSNCILASTSF